MYSIIFLFDIHFLVLHLPSPTDMLQWFWRRSNRHQSIVRLMNAMFLKQIYFNSNGGVVVLRLPIPCQATISPPPPPSSDSSQFDLNSRFYVIFNWILEQHIIIEFYSILFYDSNFFPFHSTIHPPTNYLVIQSAYSMF